MSNDGYIVYKRESVVKQKKNFQKSCRICYCIGLIGGGSERCFLSTLLLGYGAWFSLEGRIGLDVWSLRVQ